MSFKEMEVLTGAGFVRVPIGSFGAAGAADPPEVFVTSLGAVALTLEHPASPAARTSGSTRAVMDLERMASCFRLL